MAANFSDPDKHEAPDMSLAQEELYNHKGVPLSKRQRENREKYIEDYVSLRHKFPGGMNKYERSALYQFGMFFLLIGLSIVMLLLNFRMIDVYQDLLDRLDPLPETAADIGNETLLDDVSIEFEALEDTGGVCDIPHFINEFEKEELRISVLNVQRFLKAAAYITLGFGFWVTYIIKAMSHYNLCTEDFAVMRDESLIEQREANEANTKPKPSNPLGDVIRVAGGKLTNQETEGEKKIRTYLRSDTILFGLNQVFQDIPLATASILYILFLLRERGILCYESFVNGQVSDVFSLDEVDPVVFAQLTVIFLSIFANMVLNLAPRWIAFFNHMTVKHSGRPKSTTIRIFNITAAAIAYLMAIFLPLFVTLYTPVGTELFGLNTTGSDFVLVLVIFSSMFLSFGTFLMCCHWGASCSEGIFIFSTLLTAFGFGCEGCFEIEVLNLCERAC